MTYDEKSLSTVEKETIMVSRLTTADMLQFPGIRYDLNCRLHKFIREGGHPFAYMELSRKNQRIAKEDISVLDGMIYTASQGWITIPDNVMIDTDKIKFRQYDKFRGYTCLICKPYTFKGNIHKYPLQLHFQSDGRDEAYQVNGTIDYGVNGNILKATANIWINRKGWLFEFKTVKGELIISKIRSNAFTSIFELPAVIYKYEA